MVELKRENGTSLILVTIFVTVFGVVIGAILNFASVGFATTREVAGVRDMQHAVDGAMDAAINAVRGSNTAGLVGGVCPPFTYDSEKPGDPVVHVTCQGDSSSSSGGPADTTPAYAVMTGLWRTPGDTCKGFLQLGGGAGNDMHMVVNGGVFSNGRVAVNTFADTSGFPGGCSNSLLSGKSYLQVFGDVFAAGTCTWWDYAGAPKIQTFGGRLGCSNYGTKPAVLDQPPDYDPNYATADAVAQAAAAIYGGSPSKYFDPDPLCGAPGGQDVDVTFYPGVYTATPDHHVADKKCPGSVWWFQPGTYYFDFTSGDPTWAINPNNIIGGTLKNRDGYSPTSIKSRWTDGGYDHRACEDDPKTSAPGVQFIFGGASRLTARSDNNGDVGVIDLCAGASPIPELHQRLAVYALRPSDGNREGERTVSLESPATGTFDDPGNATSVGGGAATKTFTAPSGTGASIDFSGFGDLPRAGSSIESAFIEIRHSEDAASLKPNLTIHYESDNKKTPRGGEGTTLQMGSNGCQITDTDDDGFIVERCDLTPFLKGPFLWKEINSLTATYTVPDPMLRCRGNGTCDADVTARVDSVVVNVEYQAPGFQAQDSGSGDFLVTTNNPQTIFNGTFYAPYADLSVNIHNGGTTEFARGVIANSILGNASAAAKQTTAPFHLPDVERRRVVLFEASTGDTPGEHVRLRARVAFDDADGLPGRRVTILDWANRRS